MDRLRAAVIYGREDIRIEDLPKPSPGPGEVLVRIRASGVCPSDLRYYTGEKPVEKPRILGHEVAGVVEEIGEGVTKVKPGDRVAVMTDIPCGKCYYCLRGMQNLCPYKRVTDGGFSEYKVVGEDYVLRFPESVSFEEAAFTEPLSTVINGALRTGISVGSTVAIIGDGPMALLHLQVARLMGASQVIVFGRVEHRMRKALELGADAVYDSRNVDPGSVVRDHTGGLGADVAIVAVGTGEAVLQGLSTLRKQGTLLLYAGMRSGEREVRIDLNAIHYGEITVTGSSDSAPHHYRAALDLIVRRKVSVKPLISHILPLERIAEGFEIARSYKGLKVMITP